MTNMKKYIFILPLLFIVACFKKEDKITPSVKPSLKILSISPTTVQEFQPVTVKIEITDGDGDIGVENPDDKTLSIKDSRLPEADMYHVHPLAPPDTKVAIKAPLTIEIPNIFLFGNGNSEQVSFAIKVKDNSGNWSNEETSASITINR